MNNIIPLAFFCALALTNPSQMITEFSDKPLLVERNNGGFIEDFNKIFQNLKRVHTRVVIKELCMSACGRLMKLDNICAMPNTYFGFHAVYDNVNFKIYPDFTLLDAEKYELPKAVDLQIKYKSYDFGFYDEQPYEWMDVEPGVAIKYALAMKGNQIAYQKFLMVRADLLIPECEQATPDWWIRVKQFTERLGN